jgi:hypothetical protein
MKHLFCTYETSLELKELGFDDECFAYYSFQKEFLFGKTNNSWFFLHRPNLKAVAAPLYQQAIQFLFDRLEFDYPQIEIVLNSDGSGCWRQDKDCYQETRLTNKVDTSFDTLEEAVVKAIEVLKTTE